MRPKIHFTCSSLAGSGKKGVMKEDAFGYREHVIGALNSLNSSGEFYEYEGAKQLFEGSSAFMRRVKRGALRGEVGHPQFQAGQSMDDFYARIMNIQEDNVCAHFGEVWLDFESFKQDNGAPMIAIMAKVKPSGVKGEFLEKQFKNTRENTCFSIRSFTDNQYVRGRRVKTLKTIVTFDYVNEPGIAIAEKFKTPSLESLVDVPVIQENMANAMTRQEKLAEVTGMETAVISRAELFSAFGWQESFAPIWNKW